MDGHIVDLQRYRATSGKTNFIGEIKAQLFFETVLAKEVMQEPQPRHLKRLFFLKTVRIHT